MKPFHSAVDLLGRMYAVLTVPTIFVHIGKCAGSTVREELLRNDLRFIGHHLKPVRFSRRKRYLIVIRNPVSRFVSAFNWRHKLVCEGNQRDRFPTELPFFTKFSNVNDLAESLYDSDGHVQFDFQRSDSYIHHISENISYYLKDFLKECPRESIMGVIATETLHSDMQDVLGIPVTVHKRRNPGSANHLSARGRENLKQFLNEDYQCIQNLFDLGAISEEQFRILSA